MGASGTIEVDFGSTYVTDASVVVTGQAGILTSSVCEAKEFPADTSNNPEDQFMLEPIECFIKKSSLVAGAGFTITVISPYGSVGKRNLLWVWV